MSVSQYHQDNFLRPFFFPARNIRKQLARVRGCFNEYFLPFFFPYFSNPLPSPSLPFPSSAYSTTQAYPRLQGPLLQLLQQQNVEALSNSTCSNDYLSLFSSSAPSPTIQAFPRLRRPLRQLLQQQNLKALGNSTCSKGYFLSLLLNRLPSLPFPSRDYKTTTTSSAAKHQSTRQ